MDASGLSDEALQALIEDARKFLEGGHPKDPDQVRRVLEQAEQEQGLRQRMGWSNGEIGFKRDSQ